MSQMKDRKKTKRGSSKIGIRIEISQDIPKDLHDDLVKIADDFFDELAKIKKSIR